jgi:hypothetical protein
VAVKNLNDNTQNIVISIQNNANFAIADLVLGSVDGSSYYFNVGDDSTGYCSVRAVFINAHGTCDTSWGGSASDYCLEFARDGDSSMSCTATVLDNFGSNYKYSFLPGAFHMRLNGDQSGVGLTSHYVGNDRAGYCHVDITGSVCNTLTGCLYLVGGTGLNGCFLENEDEAYNEEVYWVKEAGALGGVEGDFSIDFRPLSGGVFTTGKISQTLGGDSSAAIANALNSLPNNVVDNVQVTQNNDACAVQTSTKNTKNGLRNVDILAGYTVSFDAYTNSGTQNLMSVNAAACSDGCQPLLSGLADGAGTAVTTATVVVGQAAESNSFECGARGKCDGSSGICECFEGFTGESCSTLSTLV